METIEFKNDALVTVVEQSGLEKTKGELLLQMFTPYFKRMAEIELRINSLNKDNPSKEDSAKAKEIRTALMKEVRKPAERIKDEGKKTILVEGRLYDNLYGVINNTSKALEMKCEEIEKFQELQDLKKREERKLVRIEQLTPYVDDVSFFDLLNMEDSAFDSLLATQKAGREAILAKQKKDEEDRIAKEKADAEAREAQRLENEKLKAEAAEKEKALAEERAKVEAERKAAQEKADAERKAIEKKAAEEKAIADAKLKEAQAAQAKVEAELKTKADAEAKAKKEAEDKAAAEEKAKLAAEKKAAKAPDKVKLTEMINNLQLAVVNLSPDSDAIYEQIAEKFIGFKKWALQQIESI